jgi:type VI secretion system secreted protein VgrG
MTTKYSLFGRRAGMRSAGILAVAALLLGAAPVLAATVTYPILGTAGSYAVLGASTVTNTGPTTIYGDLGLFPGSSLTGTGSITMTGTIQLTNSAAEQAQADARAAFDMLNALTATTDLTGQNLGGRTLTPGVFSMSDVTALLDGTLTLDAGGNPNSLFVFQIAHAMSTGTDSVVDVINGSADTGVFFNVGSIATLGSGTTFAGNILADQSVTFTSTAQILCGRAIGLDGAVTLDTNKISNDCVSFDDSTDRSDFGSRGFAGPLTDMSAVPIPPALPLFLSGLAALGVGGWWRKRGTAA